MTGQEEYDRVLGVCEALVQHVVDHATAQIVTGPTQNQFNALLTLKVVSTAIEKVWRIATDRADVPRSVRLTMEALAEDVADNYTILLDKGDAH